jgi:hypothetical protein
MKKRFFIYLALVLTVAYGCSFQVPSEIQITGNPSLQFDASAFEELDLGEVFREQLEGSFNDPGAGFNVVDCTNSSLPYVTYLLHMELFDEDFTLDIPYTPPSGGLPPKIEIPLTLSPELIALLPPGYSPGDTIDMEDVGGGLYTLDLEENYYVAQNELDDIDLSSVKDFMPDGFSFGSSVIARMYIEGDDIIDALTFEIDFGLKNGDGTPKITTIPPGGQNLNLSGLSGADTYTGNALPPGGVIVPILEMLNNSENEPVIKIDAYIDHTTKIDLDWLGVDSNITAELVIWLPLEMAVAPHAEMEFESLDSLKDIIESMAKEEMIKGVNINIEITPNPFAGGNLVIDTGIQKIISPLGANSFNFAINEGNFVNIRNQINSGSYNPAFSVVFPNGSPSLGIPNDFQIDIGRISVDISIDHVIEL